MGRWQTDLVTFQTGTPINTRGSIKVTWANNENTVLCDVQDISKEKIQKNYGWTDSNQYKQVFDLTQNVNWIEGNQVSFDGKQWLIKLAKGNMGKMSRSNHTYVILSRVI